MTDSNSTDRKLHTVTTDDVMLDQLGAGHTTSQDDELVARIMAGGCTLIRDTPDAYDYFMESEVAHLAVQQSQRVRRDRTHSLRVTLVVLMGLGYASGFVLSFYSTDYALVALAASGLLGFATTALAISVTARRS
jgi:hypothetical protein